MAEQTVAQMERKAVETVMDRWTNAPAFKTRLREDPKAALAECGINLTEAQVAKLGAVDLSTSAQELQKRLVKGIRVN